MYTPLPLQLCIKPHNKLHRRCLQSSLHHSLSISYTDTLKLIVENQLHLLVDIIKELAYKLREFGGSSVELRSPAWKWPRNRPRLILSIHPSSQSLHYTGHTILEKSLWTVSTAHINDRLDQYRSPMHFYQWQEERASDLKLRQWQGYLNCNRSSILLYVSSLLLHHFFLYIDIGNVPRTTRSLYNDLKRRTQGSSLLLTILSIFVLPWLTFTFCITAPFFLVDRMGWQRISALWHQKI
jgi:hypothetical protein